MYTFTETGYATLLLKIGQNYTFYEDTMENIRETWSHGRFYELGYNVAKLLSVSYDFSI